MIALNEVRADLTLAAAWCELVFPKSRGCPVFGNVYVDRSGRTIVWPRVEVPSVDLDDFLFAKIVADEALEVLGYLTRRVWEKPDSMCVACVQIGPRSNHDRIAALREFSVLR
ncbi:hypothetical protein RM543_17940 [Roseicyclus sp. F158]|uniref:Uncharacterized protein n=1 Tax=Tropicimonas omnivorans TaxID=3075590 RepID=A0ABU3DLH7_9RHOB|nr:hypothetical protein [Roseicyclus sp. F158]MDT0684557.1 hypothetical protein [Roseicyclus sp. F158]